MKLTCLFSFLLLILLLASQGYAKSIYLEDPPPYLGSGYYPPAFLYFPIQTEYSTLSAYHHDTTDIQACLGLADRYMVWGRKYDTAEFYLNQALALGKDSAQTYILFGELYRHRLQHAKAEDYFFKALQISPQNPDAYCGLANMLYLENPDKAMEYYEKAIRLPNVQAQTYTHLAELYLSKGQLDKMKNLAQQITSKSSPTANEYFAASFIYNAIGDKDRALPLFEKTIALNTTPYRNIIYQVIPQLINNYSEKTVFACLNQLLSTTKDTVLAVSIYDSLNLYQSNNPDQPLDLKRFIDFLSLVNHISTNEKENNYRRASFFSRYQNQNSMQSTKVILENRLKENTLDEESLWGLALLYSSWNRDSVSLDYYQKLLQIHPSDISILNSMAESYKKLNQYDDAIGLYRKIISLDSTDINPYYGLYDIYQNRRNNENIIELINELKSRPSQTAESYRTIYWFYLGINYQTTDISQYLKSAIKLDPTSSRYKDDLANYYIDFNQPENAEKVYIELLKYSNQDQYTYFTFDRLVGYYARTKQLNRILDFYDHASTFLPLVQYPQFLKNGIISSVQRVNQLDNFTDFLEQRFQEGQLDFNMTYLLALCYSTLNRPEDALLCYQSMYTKDPLDYNANNFLTDYYSSHNSWNKVIELTNNYIQHNPDSWEWYRKLIKAYYALHEMNQVNNTLNLIKKNALYDFRAATILPDCYKDIHQYPQAIQEYKQLISTDSTNLLHRTNLAELYSQLTDYPNAIREYEDILQVKHPVYVWERYAAMTALMPLYAKINQDSKVKDVFKSVLLQNSDLQYSTNALKNMSNIGNYKLLWELCDLAFSAQLQQHPDLTAWQVAAPLIKNQNIYGFDSVLNNQAFVAFLENKIQTDKTHPFLYFLLYKYYSQNSTDQQNIMKLKELFNTAVQSYPNDPEPLYILGDIQSQSNNSTGASQSYENAMLLQSKLHTPVNTKDADQLAWHYINSGQLEKAEQLIKSLDPDKFHIVGDLFVSLAYSLKQRRQYAKAIEAFQNAERIGFKDFTINIDLAECYLKLKQYTAVETTIMNTLPVFHDTDYPLRQLYLILIKSYDIQKLYDKEVDTYIKSISANRIHYSWTPLARDLIDINNDTIRINKIIDLLKEKTRKNPQDRISQGILAELHSYTKNKSR